MCTWWSISRGQDTGPGNGIKEVLITFSLVYSFSVQNYDRQCSIYLRYLIKNCNLVLLVRFCPINECRARLHPKLKI